MVTTLAQLRARIQTHIVDDVDAITAEFDGWINWTIRAATETHNFRALNAEEFLDTVTLTRKLGNRFTGWSDRRLDPYYVTPEGSNIKLDWITEEQARQRYGESTTIDIGGPKHLLERIVYDGTSELEEILVYPFPDALSRQPGSNPAIGEYRVFIPYYRYLPDLVADGDNNYFTNEFPNYVVWLYAAQAFFLNGFFEQALVFSQKAGYDVVAGTPIMRGTVFQGELGRMIKHDQRGRIGNRMTLAIHRDAAPRGRLRVASR